MRAPHAPRCALHIAGLGAIARRQRGAALCRSQGAQSGILILLLVMSWASKADFIRAYSPVAVSVRAVPRRVLPAACRMSHAETVAAFRTLDVAHRMFDGACRMLHVACRMSHVACCR